MTNVNDVPWSTVASRGNAKKCLVSPSRVKADTHEPALVASILFENENLKNELLVRKATAIIQQALTSDSVLFGFPSKLFGDRVEAYQLIEKQISVNVDFLPLSCLTTSTSGELLIAAKFDSAEHTRMALDRGVTVGEIVYKAVSSKCGSTVDQGLTHVQFTLLKNVSRDPDFLLSLLDSLRYYGKVYQIKKYSRKGYFEGKMSVLLDTSVGYTNSEGQVVDAEHLSRQLYLSAWDTYAPASFKNAPPICHFCRLSGHLRADCPQLAKRRCFRCRELGHTARFCNKGKKQEDLSEGDALDRYAEDSRKAAKSTKASTVVKDLTVSTKDLTVTKDLTDIIMSVAKEAPTKVALLDKVVAEPSLAEVVDLEMGEATDDAPKVPFVSGVDGPRASRYALYEDGTRMKVDSPKEMMALTKVSSTVQAKISAAKKVHPSSSATLGKGKVSKPSSSVARRA